MQTGEPSGASGKRRKTRKGTRSCWECKRRKVRCTFASPTDAVCISCAKRSTECVSQEFPDERTPPAKSRLVGDRFLRVEAMIAQLAERTGGAVPMASHTQTGKTSRDHQRTILTPATSDARTPVSTLCSDVSSRPSPSEELVIPGYLAYEGNEPVASLDGHKPLLLIGGARASLTINDKPEELSRTLLAAYPETRPFGELESMFELPESERDDLRILHARHTIKTHPVIIARQMLFLANILHQASARTLAELEEFPEEPRVVMDRLARTATSLLNVNDDIMGTAEGLECLMLESIYQANRGNIRLAWLAHRRIVGLAQIIGLHRRHYRSLVVKSLASDCVLDPRFVWYRILYVDRFLGLMLGLPPASYDSSMVSEPAFDLDSPMGKLARHHCVAAGRILERNDRDPSASDFTSTQSIDMELQKATGLLPSRWWLAPDLNAATTEKQLFLDTQRLINQTYHFYLLHQLHLPYMFHNSSSSINHGQYDYSRNTCVTASRDILNRCLIFQHHKNFPTGGHTIDLLALMASLTLLLSHLGARSTGGILEHQRLTDRAMIEQSLENVETKTSVSDNETNNKGARMLHQLLAISANPGKSLGSGRASDNETEPNAHSPLRLFVPYFGVVIVSRDGKITKETIGWGHAAHNPAQAHGNGQSDTGEFLAVLRSSGAGQQQGVQESHDNVILPTQQIPGSQGVVDGSELGSRPTPLVDGSFPSRPWFPLPTAGTDQWELQGVDFAFFDNLMREGEMSMEERGGSLW